MLRPTHLPVTPRRDARGRLVAGLAAGAVALVTPAFSSAATCAPHWVGSWAAAPSDASSGRPRLHDQTLRMIVNPHLGGSQAGSAWTTASVPGR